VSDTFKKDGDIKTILIAEGNANRRAYLNRILALQEYRVLVVSNLLSLIEALNNYHIDMLISDVDLPGISMQDLMAYIRKNYLDIKVILTVQAYSPEVELSLRPYKILYMVTWPVQDDLFKSIVARALRSDRRQAAYVSSR
jgi:DNA-binding NtrC family response regulator